MKNVLIAVLSCLLLTACSGIDTTSRTLSVIESTANLKYYYESGEAVDYLDNATLTDIEKVSLLESRDQIQRSTEYLKRYEESPETILLNIQDIAFQYSKIKSSYLSIRDIVMDNKDEYTSQEWQVFVEVDSAAKVLDMQFKHLVEATEANAALMTAIRLGNVAVKLSTLI